MPQDYFSRLLQLADEVFHATDDPEQLSIDEAVMERLQRLHPASMQENTAKDGPVVWAIVIPTTHALMTAFLAREIGEPELLTRTPEGATYDAAYLCSALVLQEFRRQGLAKRLLCRAVEAIRETHPIRSLCSWGFSEEGDALAEAFALECGVPLFKRKR